MDILKIPEEDSEQAMEKLAHLFTREQISQIITNSSNKNEVRKVLAKVLSEEVSAS